MKIISKPYLGLSFVRNLTLISIILTSLFMHLQNDWDFILNIYDVINITIIFSVAWILILLCRRLLYIVSKDVKFFIFKTVFAIFTVWTIFSSIHLTILLIDFFSLDSRGKTVAIKDIALSIKIQNLIIVYSLSIFLYLSSSFLIMLCSFNNDIKKFTQNYFSNFTKIIVLGVAIPVVVYIMTEILK